MNERKTDRTYISRTGQTKPWTDAEKLALEQTKLAGASWPDVAAACGHPKSSCQSMYSLIRRIRRKEAGEIFEPIRRKKFTRYVPPPAEPIAEPTGRTRHMSTLVQDAELRARVAILGPNGLLGDPLPGRSALDQRRAAEASAPMKLSMPPRRSPLDQTRSSLA